MQLHTLQQLHTLMQLHTLQQLHTLMQLHTLQQLHTLMQLHIHVPVLRVKRLAQLPGLLTANIHIGIELR